MFTGLAAKLGVYAIGAAVLMGAIGGAYWWGRTDGRKLERLAYEQESKENIEEARDIEAAWWVTKVAVEKDLRERAEKGKQNASSDVVRIKAELARTRAAPIPRSFARLLDDHDGAPGSANPTTGVRALGATGGDPVRGSAGDYISAEVFYEAVRKNSDRYQENVRALISCSARYDEVRETLMGMQ